MFSLLFDFRAPPLLIMKPYCFWSHLHPSFCIQGLKIVLEVEMGVCQAHGEGLSFCSSRRDEGFGRGAMKKNEEKFCTSRRDHNAHFGSDLVFWLSVVMWRGSGWLVGTHWDSECSRERVNTRIMPFFVQFLPSEGIFCHFGQFIYTTQKQSLNH